MFATGRFNESAGADFANQTYAQAYEAAFFPEAADGGSHFRLQGFPGKS